MYHWGPGTAVSSLVTCENILFFFSLWVDTTYLSNTPALVLCQDPTFVPPEGTCVVVMMDIFFFLMQNTVLKLYKLESDPLKKLYKQL